MAEAAYQTFEELGLRFMSRPHETIRREPIGGPAAWRGIDAAKRGDWVHRWSSGEIAELERALASVARHGVPLLELRREDFPLPTLGPVLAGWARELADGRGFLLAKGLPITRYSEDEASLLYWGIGQHLGTPGEQNARRELLGHVRDTGEKASNPWVRAYRTADAIAFHVDLADAVGLLCFRPARSGGESRIVSSVAIHDEFLARRPDLIDALYERYWVDRRDEARPGDSPVVPVPICRFANGSLSTFYHSDYLRSSQRHENVPRYTERQLEALELYEEIANEPELVLDMDFEPGDIQLLSNHRILHGRSAYEDREEPDEKRHLLRLWISFRDA